MRRRNKKAVSKETTLDFTISEDTVYSPFDGVFSVPFVMPKEEQYIAETPEKEQNRHSIKPFLKTAAFLSLLLILFIPTLKSDIAAFEILLDENKVLYLQTFSFSEVFFGADSLKASALKEERAYVKASKTICNSSPSAIKVSVATSKKFRLQWPTMGALVVSSPYGYRDPKISGKSFHGGIDIVTGKGNSTGIPVVAAGKGKVIFLSESYTGYGHSVMINHGNGILTRYAHMKPGSISVKVGEEVKAGQKIGEIGSTGNSTGPHLHFEVIVGGVKVEPGRYLE